MTTISKSPERHTFQKEGYIKRQQEKGEDINENYLKMFDSIINQDEHKFDEEESRKNNLEYDLVSTQWILEKARNSKFYAQNIYAALCNMQWQKLDVIPILKEDLWSCSWRYAGGIVADMIQEGDYIDWYCSGIRGGMSYDDDIQDGFVSEGTVTDEIRNDFQQLGWIPVPYEE